MNNENGELSDVKTQKNPTKQLRKPVKRLNAEVRGVVPLLWKVEAVWHTRIS